MVSDFPPVELGQALSVDAAAMQRRARAERGLRDFLYFCNWFCGFADINQEEHGEFIEKIGEVLEVIRGRRERAAAGRPLPEDVLKLTFHDEAARGTYKTSIWLAFACRLIVEDREIAIRFNLNKVENAEKKVRGIGDLLRSGRIPEHYGAFWSSDREWSRRALRVIGNNSVDPTVLAGGPDERQTSTHCDVLLSSDVQDEQNSLTDALRRGIEQWRSSEQQLFRQNSLYRLEVWDTTRWHRHDIAGQILELANRPHKNERLWILRRPVADVAEWMRDPATATLNFPKIYPREKIEELFDAAVSGIREYDVWTQYFLDTSHSEHTKFQAAWLESGPAYDPKAAAGEMAETDVCLLPKRMNLFVLIDPANAEEIRKSREKGDFEAIRTLCDTGMVLCGMDESKNRIHLESVSRQMTIPDMGDQIVEWFRRYHLPDRRKDSAEWPKFGATDRAQRNWTFKRVGVEKVVFSAGAIIEPLRTYLGTRSMLGERWARRLLNDRSAIQISTQRSKAGRQDATEVDWRSGRVRIGQHQRDLRPGTEHPCRTLVEAKKEYPVVTAWDVLDAESLCWGPGFMSAPHDIQSEDERWRAEFEEHRKRQIAMAEGSSATMDEFYMKQWKARGKGGPQLRFGPSEYMGAR